MRSCEARCWASASGDPLSWGCCGSIALERCTRIQAGLWRGCSKRDSGAASRKMSSPCRALAGDVGIPLEGNLFCSVRLRWCLGESAPETHLFGQLLIGGELVAVHSQYRDDPASRGCQPDSLGFQELLGVHEA